MNDKRNLGAFERARGEVQTPGDPRIYGVNPQPGPIPIGPAPPHIRQVISEFDSRPIGAYDFVLAAFYTPYLDIARLVVRSPLGYITIVRRIEVSVYPSLLAGVTWSFSANGVVANSWDWALTQPLVDDAINTFFVIPPDVEYGLLSNDFLTIQAASQFTVRYIGNLILDVGEPPNEQVGSLPHTVYPVQKEL
jgi:hypothetical protein